MYFVNNKINVSAVSYLNSKPFIYGLEHSGILEKINLSLDIPSLCAEKLISGQVDLGLVPIAVIPQLKEHHIITDYCIGAIGPVKSVMLYSQVPLRQIKTIVLDYQSRTSVLLARVLARFFWAINPTWEAGIEGYENQITGNIAAVVIGDRTFSMEGNFQYAYDLSTEWEAFSAMPFVFAAWIANKPLESDFTQSLNAALALGIANKEKAASEWAQKTGSQINLHDYFEKHISYALDERKTNALNLFLRLAAQIK